MASLHSATSLISKSTSKPELIKNCSETWRKFKNTYNSLRLLCTVATQKPTNKVMKTFIFQIFLAPFSDSHSLKRYWRFCLTFMSHEFVVHLSERKTNFLMGVCKGDFPNDNSIGRYRETDPVRASFSKYVL